MTGNQLEGDGVVVREVSSPTGPVAVLTDPTEPAPGVPVLGPSIGEYPVYDATLYEVMTTDTARNELFHQALAARCRGKRVLDVGTGADLNWALAAARCGARQVDAVEVVEASYHAAGQKLAALEDRALAERIRLHLGVSTELTLPDRADLCVGEVIGSVAGAEGAAAVMADVRARLLAPGGVIVPHRAVTLAAGATLREVLGGRPAAFSASWLPYLSGIFAATGGPLDVRLRVRNPAADARVTDSAEVEVLDLNGELPTDQEHQVDLAITRRGALDGVLTWMRLECAPELPPLDALQTQTNWASVFFPLFDEEITVAPGDRLTVRFQTLLSDDGVHPDYQLTATLTASGRQHTGRHVSRHHGPAFRATGAHRRLFP